MSPSSTKQRTQSRSTGPRTKAGKAASSQNALRHGLASETLLIRGESRQDFEALLTGLLEDWNPDSSTERLLVENLAKHQWLKDRALRFQSEALAKAPAGELPASFAVLLRYQTTNERAFASALRTLEMLQKTRREFVSQNEKKAVAAASSAAFARLHAPPPPTDFSWYHDEMRAAAQNQSAADAAPSSAPQSS